MSPTGRADLRKALQAITDGPSSRPASADEQVLRQLSSEHPHSIRVAPNPHRAAIDYYTCFMHALGIIDQPEYVDVAITGAAFAGTNFVASLLAKGRLQISDPQEGECLVLYFRDGRPVHAGLIRGQRVTSKWGTRSLIEHDLWEVPESYGDDARFYSPVTADEALGWFLEFAAEQQ
jgi:hypothetical protein